MTNGEYERIPAAFFEINDRTGFANGDKFEDADAVRAYFQADAQRGMFGDGCVTDQDLLDEWAELVIENRWHMAETPRVAVDLAKITQMTDAGWRVELYKNALGSYTAVAWRDADPDTRVETDDFAPGEALTRLAHKVLGEIV